jgi:hypothetical protein
VHDKREVDVEASAGLCAGDAGARPESRDAPDVCAVEKVMLETEDGVVGIILPASPSRQQAQSPWAGPSGKTRTRENWNRFSVLQADLPGVKRRQDGLPCKVEGAAGFEEELTLFGEEDREAGQVDDLPVRFDLRKVRVDREVRREGRRNAKLGIHPCLGIAVAGLDHTVGARPGDDAFRGDGLPEQVRPELEISSAMHLAEPGQRTGLDQIVESLGSPPGSPKRCLVPSPDKALHIEPEHAVVSSVKPERAQRYSELCRPAF